MVRCESCPSTIGHITLGTKQTGAPSAGNPHAGCDVAGAGNGFTVWLLRHSQRKRGETARLDLRNTAPVLDPTGLSEVWGVARNRCSLKTGRSQPVGATPSDMNSFSKGGVYGTRKTGQAFHGAADRHVAPLEGGRVVA